MNGQTNDEHLHERLMVSTALGAQQRDPDAEAWQPDEALWQDFLQGGLGADKQEAMLAYLDSHPDAYDRWVAGAQPEAGAETGNLWQRLGRWLTGQGSQQPWALPAAALGVVALLSLVLLMRGPAGVDGELDLAYERIAELGVAMPATDAVFPDFAEDPAFGFAGSGIRSHSLGAFVQGIGDGRRQLEESLGSGTETAAQQSETPWPEYFKLGRWYYLTWFVARTGLAPQAHFWSGQERILQQIRSVMEFRRGDAAEQPVTRQLDAIAELLGRLENTPDNARLRRDLRRELESLWQVMRLAEGG